MKQHIYESKYSSVHIDFETDIFFHIWYASTEIMTDEEYKKEYGQLLEALSEFDKLPQKNFIDLQQFKYFLSPEMQDWHSEHIFSRFLPDKKRYLAVRNSIDFVASLYVEQTFEELFENGHEVIKKHFSNEKDALDWLLEIKV